LSDAVFGHIKHSTTLVVTPNKAATTTKMLSENAAHIKNFIFYTFVNDDLLTEALTAADHIDGGESIEGNRRLARLGDSVIKLVVDDQWFSTGGHRSKHRYYPRFSLIAYRRER